MFFTGSRHSSVVVVVVMVVGMVVQKLVPIALHKRTFLFRVRYLRTTWLSLYLHYNTFFMLWCPIFKAGLSPYSFTGDYTT